MTHETQGTDPTQKPSRPELSLGGFAGRVLIAVGIVIGVLLVLFLLWISARVILLSFAGVLLAVFLRGLGGFISRTTGMPGQWAVGTALALFLGVGTLAGWMIVPRIAEQIPELAERLPRAIEELRTQVEEYGLGRFFPKDLGSFELGQPTAPALSQVGIFFASTIGVLTSTFLMVFVGIYFAFAPWSYVSGIIQLFPMRARERAEEILLQIGTTLHKWLIGQLVSMTVVGVLIWLGLTILGVPLPLTLGFLAGLLDFIPIVGPLFSAIPAVLLAFLISPLHALYVIVLYIVVNTFIESNLLVPLIQRYAVRLPPALALIALVLMSSLFGFLGMLLATPAAAAALVLVKAVYVQDILGDKSIEPVPVKPASE